MPVEFYIHNPYIDLQNERRAMCYVARQLHQRYQKSDKHYILIANIDPEIDPEMLKTKRISQLEGILIGPQSIAILEFKNYFDPIHARNLMNFWFAEGQTPGGKPRKQQVKGGSKDNPFLQAEHARNVWRPYMREKCQETFEACRYESLSPIIERFSYYLLFHPYLNKRSTFPQLGDDHYWFFIRGIRAILELTYAVNDDHVYIAPDTMRKLATDVFNAKPWTEVDKLLHTKIGFLDISEPDKKEAIRHPLYRFQEFSLGRSSAIEGHQVDEKYDLVSGNHAQIITDQNNVYIQDLGSTNGTYRNKIKITESEPMQISHSDQIYLGSWKSGGIELKYTPAPTHITKDTRSLTRKTIAKKF